MKSIRDIGLKITSAQREYFRYTGDSAKLERRGAGTSRPELAWVRRQPQQTQQGTPQQTRAELFDGKTHSNQ